MNIRRRVLFSNTIMLYILVFSSYFFAFISVPYQTRILGPEYFGRIGFSLAFMSFFRLIIDFGFILSATEEVSKNRDNVFILSKIVTAVNIIKGFLMIISLIIILVLMLFVPRLRADILLNILTFFFVALGAFLPDFLYRGLEKTKIITIRTVFIQASFLLLIFLLIKDKEQYYYIPLLLLICNFVAIIFVYVHAYKSIGIKLVKVEFNYILEVFKKSCFYFYSRIASTVYSSSNTFILGLIYPFGSDFVGLYSSADRLISAARTLFSPIADSLFPYMIKNRDYRLLWKILYIIMIPVIIGCIIIGVYAESFVAIILGEEFKEAGEIFRILLPIVIITPLIYLLGFPILTPMGLSKHANFSVIFGSVFHLSGLVLLYIIGELNVINLCYLTVSTEFLILVYRVIIIFINRNLLNNQ